MRCKTLAAISVLLAAALGPGPALASPTRIPTGVTIHRDGVSDGYVILTTGNVIYAIDVTGHVANRWTSSIAGYTFRYAEPLENGNLLVRARNNDLGLDKMLEIDQSGAVLWQFDQPEDKLAFHHDQARLANGNTLILCSQALDVESISERTLVDDCLMEVTPAGEVVWEWRTADHFDELELRDDEKERIFAKGGDWAHANAIDEISPDTSHSDPALQPGNIIISYRHLNTVAIIDRFTGHFVWKMQHVTIGQHNSHMLTDDLWGGGNILVFDNGLDRYNNGQIVDNRPYSRVLEIDPTDQSIVWDYDATKSGLIDYSFWSHFISSAQRLPNGNTLIDEGGDGRIFEVQRNGRIVWEYIAPFTSNNGNRQRIYRAMKVPRDWLIAFSEAPAPLCGGLAVTILGTDGHDELQGTPGPDVIHGMGGHDVIHGGGGDDVICGGPGNDTIIGGPGSDRLYGHGGNDSCYANTDTDTLVGCEFIRETP